MDEAVTGSPGSFCRDKCYSNNGLPAFVEMVRPVHRLILDVGCGDGANMRLLKTRGFNPVGLTLSLQEATCCRRSGISCVISDVSEGNFPFRGGSFDALLFCHVLEHLPSPTNVLERCKALLREGGSVYIALPNVLQIHQRLNFLAGRFRYAETGIMDATHLRFFDFQSAKSMVEDAGYRVLSHKAVGQLPSGPLRRIAPGFAKTLDGYVSSRMPGLFGVHILMEARPV